MTETEFTVETLEECRFGLDGGAMFGVVPRPLWSRSTVPDEANRIPMAARCLLLRRPGQVVLVDAGMGEKWSAREQEIYALQTTPGGLTAALAARGVRADDVTDVVVTHLHFDHAGGLTRCGEDGTVAANFPRAVHWIQRENWVWAHHPTPRDAGSYRRENFSFLAEPGAPPVRLVDGVARVCGDAIEVLPSRGHTPGMQLLRFRAAGRDIVYVADLIPTVAHIPLAWGMGYDLYPTETIREKRELLDQAARHDWILAMEHDPDHAFVAVEAAGPDRWRVAASGATPDALR
jgi:glyoxylase-like metal-dependent hydrolase (beta-lactamase superfamily II)